MTDTNDPGEKTITLTINEFHEAAYEMRNMSGMGEDYTFVAAALIGNTNILSQEIEAGYGLSKDTCGDRLIDHALYQVAEKEDEKMCDFLLSHGANANYGLHAVLGKSNRTLVRKFLQHDINFNFECYSGQSITKEAYEEEKDPFVLSMLQAHGMPIYGQVYPEATPVSL